MFLYNKTKSLFDQTQNCTLPRLQKTNIQVQSVRVYGQEPKIPRSTFDITCEWHRFQEIQMRFMLVQYKEKKQVGTAHDSA